MQRCRGSKQRRTVGGVRHDRAKAGTHLRQTAVDKCHKDASDDSRTRDLAHETVRIAHTEPLDILGDNKAKGERSEQVHGLVSRKESLDGGGAIVGRLGRLRHAGGRDER